MLKRLKMLGVIAAATILMAVPASAATVIDFGTGLAGTGGSISWDGANLIGTNIPIGSVEVTGAPSNNGVYLVSGTATGGGGGLYGDLNFNTATGDISILGCIDALNVGDTTCAQPLTLLSGTITSFGANFGAFGLATAIGNDTKNALLLESIGLPPTTPFELFGFSIATSNLNPNGTPGTATSTDIRNTAVPEPATMMLLGTGLLAAFRARRKQQV
jgi:hypothetical protein